MAILAELTQSPYFVQSLGIALVAILITIFWQDFADEIPYRRIPLVGKDGWDIFNKKARQRFKSSARTLIRDGFAKVGQRSKWRYHSLTQPRESLLTPPRQGMNVFQIMSAIRPLVVLHPKYIDEVKNHPDLDFQGAVGRVGQPSTTFIVKGPPDH